MAKPTTLGDNRRQYAPATARNRDPILTVLKRVLPKNGIMLEIGAGSGEHAAYFAPHFPDLTWQPSEPDPDSRGSVAAWVEATAAANLRPPINLSVTDAEWPVAIAQAIFSANMIHIAPWACCQGLMAGAGRTLAPNGLLILYGPFKRDGEHTAPSNAQFDASLRQRDPAWGIRDLDDVTACAEESGLARTEIVDMPANNLMLIFEART
ncbi:MAG: DUF938 domain-containing protein [Alphaproteobacteria bacterium]|jgi:hypothetical protein|nr:DUF938 domain-containing protein [Alphaproteobacteria bacterium]